MFYLGWEITALADAVDRPLEDERDDEARANSEQETSVRE